MINRQLILLSLISILVMSVLVIIYALFMGSGIENVAYIERAIEAARHQDVDEFQRIVSTCPNINYQTGARERTLAHELAYRFEMFANYENLGRMLKGIVDAGGDINMRDCYGRTPLTAAMERSVWVKTNPNTLYSIFIEHGARDNMVDKNGLTARDYYLRALGVGDSGVTSQHQTNGMAGGKVTP